MTDWQELDGGRRTRYGPREGRTPTAQIATWVKVHHRGAKQCGGEFRVGERLVAIAWPVRLHPTDWWLAMRPMENTGRWG